MVFLLAYATAYGETLTIAHFPYYTFKVGRGRAGAFWREAFRLPLRGRMGVVMRAPPQWVMNELWGVPAPSPSANPSRPCTHFTRIARAARRMPAQQAAPCQRSACAVLDSLHA